MRLKFIFLFVDEGIEAVWSPPFQRDAPKATKITFDSDED